MEIYTHSSQALGEYKKSILTIGNFDGVHLGHRHLISKMKELSRQSGSPCVVMTFFPHPLSILKPDISFLYLQTREDMFRELKSLGVDVVILLPFDREMSQLSAEDFFNQYIESPLAPSALFIGPDFAFGKGKSGDIAFLREKSQSLGFDLNIFDKYKVDGVAVSSSYIRQQLSDGDLEQVERFLGRKYSLTQTVIKGEGRGKTIGVPTANLNIDHALALKPGVYVTQTKVLNQKYSSVTNVGVNPTFQSQHEGVGNIKVETHLLDAEFDFYGQLIQVQFFKRLRDEKKFPGPKQLIEQIKKDKQQAAEYFISHGKMGRN